MNENLIKKYTDFAKNGTVLTGRVTFTQHHPTLDEDILMIDLGEVPCIITREELDVKPIKTSLVNFIGKRLNFIVKEVDAEAGVVICSRKSIKEVERDIVIEKLQEGSEMEATIEKILPYGAYVDINGATAFLRNQDYATDFTTIADKLKVGDKLKVVLNRTSSTNKIYVEAIEKFSNPSVINLEDFEPNQVLFGLVRNVKPFGCFVCIADGLDALAPVPQTMEIEEGMKVVFKVEEVLPEEKRVRGKILKVIFDEE